MTRSPRGKAGPAPANQRGRDRREALIAAGLALFGEHGLSATSTRMLAARSGANVAAIPYYFGSKEGLYLAVAEHIVEQVDSHIGPLAGGLGEALDAGTLSPRAARDALERLIHAMAAVFVESDEPRAWVQFIMREQARPTEAFDVLYKGRIKQTQDVIASLIGVGTGLDPDGDEARVRAHALVGQVLGFVVSRESLLRHLRTTKLKRRHIELIHSVLSAHVRACLDISPISEPRS